MSVASFLHSSFLRVISAVMLWPVHVQKVPQASEHLCSAKLHTRCDICCACQSIIPTDSGVPRTVDSMNHLQKVESGMGCPNWYTAMHSLWLQRLLYVHVHIVYIL